MTWLDDYSLRCPLLASIVINSVLIVDGNNGVFVIHEIYINKNRARVEQPITTAAYLKGRPLIRHLGDSTTYQYKCVLQYKQQRYPANRTSSDCLQLYKSQPLSLMGRCDRLVIVVYLFISCCHDWDDAHEFMIMSTCIARFNWLRGCLWAVSSTYSYYVQQSHWAIESFASPKVSGIDHQKTLTWLK